jgi:nucleotide-binding universal stress UspA family protein
MSQDTPAFHAILVPLDGSVFAEQSVQVAAALGRKSGAALHLLSVHEPMPVAALPLEFPAAISDLDERSRENLEEYLQSLADLLRGSDGLSVVTAVPTGRAADEIARYVESQRIDLVVMATHGRSGPSRWWLGSTADRLLRRVTVPVLLLPPSRLPYPTEFRRVLLALDGEIEDPVVEAALALAGVANTRRWVLARVVEPGIPVVSGLAARPARLPPDWTQRRETEARNYLARLRDRLQVTGVDVNTQILVGRGVASQILQLAGALGSDCIVAGTHGARGMERVLLGSVADKIVRGSEIPVLVAPSAGGRSASSPPGDAVAAVAAVAADG